jgi:hypothetical protein
MPPRRERPLPVEISLDALPPPEAKRNRRLALHFTEGEFPLIEQAAHKRGEQAAVLCRTIILMAFQNFAWRALEEKPDLLTMTPAEQQRALLEIFSAPGKGPEILPPPEAKRNRRLPLAFSDSELAMIDKAARERGEQPAVLCRIIILSTLQNSAARKDPDPETISPAEQQRILLEALSFKMP